MSSVGKMKSAVLGIDAAWTDHQPSGVALVRKDKKVWVCVAVAPSYETFLRLADGETVNWDAPTQGSEPVPSDLLQAARKLLDGSDMKVVAVDMPVSNVVIRGRRAADNRISEEYGGKKKCGTHSPRPSRPGKISTAVSIGFGKLGFHIATERTPAGTESRLVEVYPHPALLSLLGLEVRFMYKVSKSSRYWPGRSQGDRIQLIADNLNQIRSALGVHFSDLSHHFPIVPKPQHFTDLKRYEDSLDALVCAWTGIEYLAGRAKAFGDENSAIWVPL